MSGIPQTGAERYVSINVYPGSGRWRVAVLLREAGRPNPRLVRTVGIVDLDEDIHDLPGALRAASKVLLEVAETGPESPA